jgi:hypothetical protein
LKSGGLSGRRRSTGEIQRAFLLVVIMVLAAIAASGIATLQLYSTALRKERARLREIAQSHAQLIEAMAVDADVERFPNRADSVISAVLNRLRSAQSPFPGPGKTGELTLSRREGDSIVLLLRRRYPATDVPPPVPWNSALAAPSRRALSGLSGTMVGKNNRGVTVLAAYEPVGALGLGVVAEIDLAEMRAPFVDVGLTTLLVTIAFICIGTLFFTRITNPVIRRLKEDEETFSSMFHLSPVPVNSHYF